MEVVASLSQGRTAAGQCGLFTYKSVPVIFEPPCTIDFKPYFSAVQLVSYSEMEQIYCMDILTDKKRITCTT